MCKTLKEMKIGEKGFIPINCYYRDTNLTERGTLKELLAIYLSEKQKFKKEEDIFYSIPVKREDVLTYSVIVEGEKYLLHLNETYIFPISENAVIKKYPSFTSQELKEFKNKVKETVGRGLVKGEGPIEFHNIPSSEAEKWKNLLGGSSCSKSELI